MSYTWQQKQSHDPIWKWDHIETSDNLWHLVRQASAFKSHVSHSGQTGTHYIQQRIIDDTGKSYSVHLTKDMCFQIMAMHIAEEAFQEGRP